VRGFAPQPLTNGTLLFLELDLKDLDSLRTCRLKVSLNLDELALIDSKRGSFPRASWIRAAALGVELKAAPAPELAATWQSSARLAACLTQLNEHVTNLNSIRLHDGQAAAADRLAVELEKTRQLLFEFRASLGQDK
jgi:hypothetical protein